MYRIFLWNGYSNKLELFRGDEEAAAYAADVYKETGDKVIYFYAAIVNIELEAM